jgi:hypothetical protein
MVLNTTECIYSARSLNSARILALSFVAHFTGLAVPVVGTGSCDGWLGAEEFVTNTVSWAVSIHQTLLLLTANLLIVWIPEEAIRASTDSLVTP